MLRTLFSEYTICKISIVDFLITLFSIFASCLSNRLIFIIPVSITNGQQENFDPPLIRNRCNGTTLRKVIVLSILLLRAVSLSAQVQRTDTFSFTPRFECRIGAEFEPGYIFQTHDFLRGNNSNWKPIRNFSAFHLKYAFRPLPGTCIDRLYGGPYQGVGLAVHSFGSRREVGTPISIYLFQGARIASLSDYLSFNYEWNFGVSAGWKPYDYEKNPYNQVIGSSVNAYIHTDFYLNWALSPRWNIKSGLSLSHFSNGNTDFPNAGLNTAALKLGFAYYFGRDDRPSPTPVSFEPIPEFRRHISYDLLLFGSWRRRGLLLGDNQIASPGSYTVLGFNFTPMYNFGYRFRAGVSLDGVYDGSANIYVPSYHSGSTPYFLFPSLDRQLALGLSGRAEYVMPWFTIGIGVGKNFLYGKGNLNGWYQLLALKIELTRNSFVHIGYSLQDFNEPNFLMLGIGYRFNNQYPSLYRKRR